MKKLLTVVFAILAGSAFAQVSVQITNVPLTTFEAATQAKGAVLVRGISHIGRLNGQSTFPLEVRVEELLNLNYSNHVYAVVLRTKTPQQTLIHYIDYEEVEALLAGIRFIVQADHNVSSLEQFNTYFQTKSGLTISRYSLDNRNFTALKNGTNDPDPNIMDLPAIAEFETLLVAAKTKLDTLKRNAR